MHRYRSTARIHVWTSEFCGVARELYIPANRELIIGIERNRSRWLSRCFKAAGETSIRSYVDLYFVKNQPHRSRAGRELTLAMPASVAYTQYSCAHHAPKSAIILGKWNRSAVYIYSRYAYLTTIGVLCLSFPPHLWNFRVFSLARRFFKQTPK